ncbi:MAG: phosphatase PAP2 family protein [Planctomycetaceae bacterium]
MSRDSFVKLIIIGIELLLVATLMLSRGLTVPTQDLRMPIVVGAVLLGVAAFYRKRGVSSFVLCLLGLTHVVVFTAGYTLLMYSTATLNRPLVDANLAAFDQSCGVSLPAIVAWAKANPNIRGWLNMTYDSLLPQTALVVMVLGLRGKRLPMEQFMMQFMLTTLLCIVGLALMPAIGPFHHYGYEMNVAQTRYVEHFTALRDGTMTKLTLSQAEGLITFPSFHTTWAILLAWAYRRQMLLFIPLSLINLAVIASTLTSGWHYFADLCSGVLIAVIAIWFTHAVRHWFYDENEQPRMLFGQASST